MTKDEGLLGPESRLYEGLEKLLHFIESQKEKDE